VKGFKETVCQKFSIELLIFNWMLTFSVHDIGDKGMSEEKRTLGGSIQRWECNIKIGPKVV
jgi:hypothetical protein